MKKITDEKQRATSLNASVPLWYLEAIQWYCHDNGITQSQLIRNALDAYIGE